MSEKNILSSQPLLDRLTHIVSKAGLLKRFSNLKTVERKISFCLSPKDIKYDDSTTINLKEEISSYLQVFYEASAKHLKSNEKAEQFKVKGSAAFMKQKDELAGKLYTDGLRFAQHDSHLSSVLYANRSASHIHRKNYEACLSDIRRAEAAGYPLEARYKLHKRKLEALINLKRKKEALEALKEARMCIVSSDKDRFLNQLNEIEVRAKRLRISEEATVKTDSVSPLPKLFQDEGKEMSGALNIRVNEKEGRHIRTCTNIPKGSTLFTETPYAAILLPEYFLTHCQRCFSSLTNPVPCKLCSDVLWCNEHCREQGEAFHKFECGQLHILTSVGIAHLAVRIVLLAGWPLCLEIKKEGKTGVQNSEEDLTRLFHSKDKRSQYKAVFSLLNHLNKAALDDLLQYCLAGTLLGKVIIERTNFLDWKSNPSLRNDHDEVHLASLLVHHISQLVSNAHAVTQIEERYQGETSAVCQISQRRIASAIYPLASLMNHSCKPSIINSFLNDILVIHSIEEIKNGYQLYNCYGPHASRQERGERLASLQRQYFFHCDCIACTDDSYLIKEANWSGLICPNCRGIAIMIDEDKTGENEMFRCLQCEVRRSLPMNMRQRCTEANNYYEEGLESFQREKFEDAENNFLEALRIGEKVFSKHNEFFNTIRDNLAKTYTVRGKLDDALRHLFLCLETVEYRFGKDSVETAHELLKYLDVVRIAQKSNSSLKINPEELKRRIETIFTTHYGESWQNYLKLEPI